MSFQISIYYISCWLTCSFCCSLLAAGVSLSSAEVGVILRIIPPLLAVLPDTNAARSLRNSSGWIKPRHQCNVKIQVSVPWLICGKHNGQMWDKFLDVFLMELSDCRYKTPTATYSVHINILFTKDCLIPTHLKMDNTYREAADPPEECSPENKKITKSKETSVQEIGICCTNSLSSLTVMNILLTSPTLLVLLSSSLATSVNSLVKKTSSGITGIYTS